MHRRTAVLAAAVSLPLFLAGCGGGSSSGGAPSAKNVAAATTAVNAGLKAQEAGDTATATSEYQQALKDDPTNKFALFDLGIIAANQKDTGTAISDYAKSIASDSKFEPALYNLGLIYEGEGNTTAALPLMQRAVASNPNDAAAHYHLALLLRLLPKYKHDGNVQMQIALRIDPSLTDPAGIVKSKKK